MLESFNKVAGLKVCDFIKKDSNTGAVNIAKFLRIPTAKNISKRQLLHNASKRFKTFGNSFCSETFRILRNGTTVVESIFVKLRNFTKIGYLSTIYPVNVQNISWKTGL